MLHVKLEFMNLTIGLIFDIFMLDNGEGFMVHVRISFVHYVQ
jgi:hypothetical protein